LHQFKPRPDGKEVTIKNMRRFAVVGFLSLLTMIGFGATPGIAQPRAHVYLLRGLLNIFSLGMDTLAEKIQRRGIYATVHNHTEWEALADQAAAAYRAGKEGPIIIVGHSLGADAVIANVGLAGPERRSGRSRSAVRRQGIVCHIE
jgi:hypothetical protein